MNIAVFASHGGSDLQAIIDGCKNEQINATVVVVIQCQLVKNFENRINRLNIGIKCHSGINLETNGVDNAIRQAVFFVLLHGK